MDAKTLNLAGYKDEDGKTRQLCATHARAAGTHAVQVPCRDCPEDAKVDAHFEDEDGKAQQLCATHARAANTWEPTEDRNRAHKPWGRARE